MAQADDQKQAQRLFVRAAATDDQQAEACLAGVQVYIDLVDRCAPPMQVVRCQHRSETIQSSGCDIDLWLQAVPLAQTWRTTYLLIVYRPRAAVAPLLVDKVVNKALQEVCLTIFLVSTQVNFV